MTAGEICRRAGTASVQPTMQAMHVFECTQSETDGHWVLCDHGHPATHLLWAFTPAVPSTCPLPTEPPSNGACCPAPAGCRRQAWHRPCKETSNGTAAPPSSPGGWAGLETALGTTGVAEQCTCAHSATTASAPQELFTSVLLQACSTPPPAGHRRAASACESGQTRPHHSPATSPTSQGRPATPTPMVLHPAALPALSQMAPFPVAL